MKFEFDMSGSKWAIDTAACIDLSIPVDCKNGLGAKAWYIDRPTTVPVQLGDWVGNVAKGGAVNFNDLRINPHAHGTHTESLGHISPNQESVEGLFDEFFFEALVVSVAVANDAVITCKMLKEALDKIDSGFWPAGPRALILRTLPNDLNKRITDYDHKGWPYLGVDAAQLLVDMGVEHLLIDTPSVDPEKDQGALLAHKTFWQFPKHPRLKATITEFIYVPDKVQDGPYLLELQTAAIVNDATFSRPLIYALEAL